MLTIIIDKECIRDVTVVENKIEVCTKRGESMEMMIKITPEAWEEINRGAKESLERGASPGKEVE
ncbi:hypothetical protein ES708_13876 [subsurface metagenome]